MCMEMDGNYVNLSAHNRRDLLHNVTHYNIYIYIVGINFIASFLYMEHTMDSCEIKCHMLGHVILDIFLAKYV